MSYDTELAKHFKNRDNPDVDEPIIGDIISVNPIKVSIMRGNFILDSKLCYICESLKSITGTITLDNVADHGAITTGFTITRDLNIGDKVMCVPTSKGNKYFIVDKVVG